MPKLRRTFKNIEKDLGNIKQIKGKDVDEFVFALKAEGHTHVHFSDKVRATPVVLSIIKESGIRVDPPEGKKIERIATKDRKIIFSHRRALGDALMFSAGIRDFKLLFPDIKINVDSNQPSIWVNNPYLDTSLKKEDPGVEFYRVGYPAVGNANNTAIHFTTMFLLDMIAITDLHSKLPISLGEFAAAFSNGSVGDPSLGKPEKNPEAREPFISLRKQYKNICENFVRQRGDIHLTEEEKEHNLIKDLYGVDKYWVIAPGGKRDCTSKIWDWRGFQEVIDYFEGRIKFVVIGKSDLLVEKLNNVIDLTDKFNSDVRGIFSLVYNAEGCVAGPSFLMHLAAAMPPRFKKERKPCVSIFGGREPSAWSWYCNQQILHTNGVFSCCDNGGCWTARTHPMQKDPKHNRNLCRNTVKIDDRTVQACMEAITPTDVIMAIDKYYSGDLYKLEKIPVQKPIQVKNAIENIQVSGGKEINLLGNLNSSGGGEQSLVTIAGMLRKDGWKVNLYPWSTVNDRFRDVEVMPRSFKDGLGSSIVPGVPLLFYANDCVWDFVKEGQDVVDRSSSVIVGINYANGSLPKAEWLAKSGKLKAVIFQNEEKKQEFIRDEIGFNGTKKGVEFNGDRNKNIQLL
ncbi:MAG: hypothetical protein KKD77_20830 [Gammaproteobacteria bacterium]|nr:hypothetical protein [Gammaproteobacteria bacterium]